MASSMTPTRRQQKITRRQGGGTGGRPLQGHFVVVGGHPINGRDSSTVVGGHPTKSRHERVRGIVLLSRPRSVTGERRIGD
jgi:hypothetical protein